MWTSCVTEPSFRYVSHLYRSDWLAVVTPTTTTLPKHFITFILNQVPEKKPPNITSSHLNAIEAVFLNYISKSTFCLIGCSKVGVREQCMMGILCRNTLNIGEISKTSDSICVCSAPRQHLRSAAVQRRRGGLTSASERR